MKALSSEYPIRRICEKLEISFGCYYAWLRKESHSLRGSKLEQSDKVKEVFDEHLRRYGAIRISKELQSQGISIGRHRVSSLMKLQDLKAIQPKSFVPKTTNSNHKLDRSPNLLLEIGKAERPYQVIAGDITFIPMQDGSWIYLSAWQDQYTRVIVGWKLDVNMKSEMVIESLEDAIKRKPLAQGLIVHSDGGGQYASAKFRAVLRKYGFAQSMTRRGKHNDNGMAESFWSRMKAELIGKNAFANFGDAYTEIFEYIEIYYNNKRRHSGINYKTPIKFERSYFEKSK